MRIQRGRNGNYFELYKLSAGFRVGIKGNTYSTFGYKYRSIVVYLGKYVSFIQWRLYVG